jgi:hypothetical protein
MTDAQKSKYSSKPWQPTIDPKDGSQKKAGEDYAKVYGGRPVEGTPDKSGDPPVSGKVPAVSMAYTQAPHLIPWTNTGGEGSGSRDMQAGAFVARLSSVRTAEQACLDATAKAVTGYDTLKDVVMRAAASEDLFGQHVGTWVDGTHGQQATPDTVSAPVWHPDKYDESGQQFAASIVPQMKNLLNAAGGAIEAMGTYNALLNNACQLYATIDRNCAMTAGPGGVGETG